MLNHNFSEWVESYNNRIHGTTKQTPYDRYRSHLECVRPAPPELLNYFRQIEFRHVKKDRTVRLMSTVFEVPVSLIDRKVELHFHAEDLSQVEVYFQGKSYGFASVVNPYVNSSIGRNWSQSEISKKADEEVFQVENSTPTGELFKAPEEELT